MSGSGADSLGRLLEVSRLIFNIYCCQLNCDCFLWFWPYVTVSRNCWYGACILGYETCQLEEFGQILSCQRKLRRCQERSRGQMGCKGDQVSVGIFTPSQIAMSCGALAYACVSVTVMAGSGYSWKQAATLPGALLPISLRTAGVGVEAIPMFSDQGVFRKNISSPANGKKSHLW